MIRRRYGKSLSRGTTIPDEDVNPNAYISNIADCMLVLMLGFMVALISYFGIELEQEPSPDDIIGLEMNLDKNDDGVVDDGFDRAGTVYRDSETGAYYLVTSE